MSQFLRTVGNAMLVEMSRQQFEGMKNDVCAYCGGPKMIRNPRGDCDHLHWPDNLTDEAKRANGYREVVATRWVK